jgi:hypothetical protein
LATLPFVPIVSDVARILPWLVFLGIFLLLIGGAHYYLWARLVRDAALAPKLRFWATTVLVALALMIPLAMIFGRRASAELSGYLMLPPYVWLGVLWIAFVCLIFGDVIKGALFLLPKSLGQEGSLLDPSRRLTLSRHFAGGIAVATGAVS